MPHTPSGGTRCGTADPGTAARDGGRPQSIGAVLGALRKEFPEVTVSRIRFLEAEGLIRPERSPSGHRRFCDADVRRLRRILGLQRDHCLPLRAIREYLDTAGDPAGRGGEAPEPAAGEAPGAAAGRSGRRAGQAVRPVRVGRDRLLAAAGATEAECAQWDAYGLLRPDGSGWYDVAQIAVARTLVELGRQGFEPRHLRAVKGAADRTASLVGQVVAPLRARRDPRARERAEVTARELARLAAQLHDGFLRSALQPPDAGGDRRVREHTDARAERVPDYPNRPGTS